MRSCAVRERLCPIARPPRTGAVLSYWRPPMIAHAKSGPRDDSVPRWHQPFLKMLPAIHRHARIAFRHLDPEARAEMVEEVVANAFVAYQRLVELGKADLAYPTPLAS